MAPVKSAEREIWRALFFYNSYRLILGAVALLAAFSDHAWSAAHIDQPVFYQGAAVVYLALTMLSIMLWYRRWPGYGGQGVFAILIDLVALMLLIRASGGLGHSAAEVLLFVPVAASGILLPGRMAMFTASVAIVLVLVQTGMEVLHHNNDLSLFLHAGLLGIVLLATALVVNRLAAQAKKSEELVKVHAASLQDLGNINELVIQAMESGVLVLDSHDAPLFMNNRARELLGIKRKDLSGLDLSRISEKLAGELGRWTRQAGYRRDFTCNRTQTAIQAVFSPLLNGRNLGTLLLLEEVGEARRREQQTRLAALGRLTGSIAHEIRNPLSAISQAAQLLASDAGTGQQTRLAEMIERNSARINRIVEDVMALNKSGPLEREPLQLGVWLDSFVGRYCRDHHLGESVIRPGDIKDHVLFDASHLEQVMRNLLDNAMQHGDAGRMPMVVISARKKDAAAVWLDVRDNGPGVAADLTETIFEPFYTGRPDGTGLGLYISRELCEINGGHLEYVSLDAGQGGFFRITMERANKQNEQD